MPTELLDVLWFKSCGGNEDLASVAGVVKQKAAGDFMVPVYDLYTHRNGDYSNVEANYNDDTGYVLVATRNIQKGEQLHRSYDKCLECDLLMKWDMDYGTPGKFF